MSRVLQFLLWVHSIDAILATWTLSDKSLFYGTDGMAVGTYDDTIYIIGGWQCENQVTEYKYKTDTLIDIGSTALSSTSFGMDQYWAQNRTTLYFINYDHSPSQLSAYDLVTKTSTAVFTTIPTEIGDRGCLASHGGYLYVVTARTAQIFNLVTRQWTDASDMKERRKGSACIVHNDYLWAIGGYLTATNERVSTIGITQNEWQFVDSFTVASQVYAPRCVAWRDSIYIIGGEVSSGEGINIVHVMDAVTGTITVLADRLPYLGRNTAPIVVDAVLYVFGGLKTTQNVVIWKWAYYSLPTVAPTPQPTPQPTPKPTGNPTPNPTKRPTPNPTANPTAKPTANPTKKPTPNLTQTPTANPTQRPTNPAGTATCGDTVIGAYNGAPVTFMVNMPYEGDLQFTAATSHFVVTHIEAFTASNIPLGTDTDHDEVITLIDRPAGDYKFIITGEGTQSGVFEATINCFSRSPTPGPTSPPIMVTDPTASPMKKPTSNPLPTETERPSDAAVSDNPTNRPSQALMTALISTEREASSGVKPKSNTLWINGSSEWTLGLVAIGAASVCGCLCLCAYLLVTRRKKKKYQQNENEIVNIGESNAQPAGEAQQVVAAEDNEFHTNIMVDPADRNAVMDWMIHTVKLPHYARMFVDKGYDSMRAIMAIQNEQQLSAVGVKRLGHQTLILSEIKKLAIAPKTRAPDLPPLPGILNNDLNGLHGDGGMETILDSDQDSVSDDLFRVMEPTKGTGQGIPQMSPVTVPPPPPIVYTVEGGEF